MPTGEAMSPALRALIATLAALVAVSGLAAAEPCPECDEDGEPADNTYHSIDLGVVHDNATALADTDLALSHQNDEKGFWGWISICLTAFVDKVGEMLGVEADVNGHADVYASEEGVDVDASLEDVDFDESALGDLDGMTFEAMGEVNDRRAQMGLGGHLPLGAPEMDDTDTDVCVHADLGISCV